jgi:UPF0755 protein
MADRSGRTAREREAARLERERKRAGMPPLPRSPSADPDPPPVRPGAAPPVTPPVVPPEAYEHDGHGDTDEHEFELPSGTRRVSHSESAAGKRRQTQPRKQPRAGRRPRRVARRRPAQSELSGHSRTGRIVSILALVVAAALIWFLVELFQPFQGSAHGRVTVEIPEHATSSKIGDLLARDGVISSSFFFELRATLAGERSDLRAGIYHLQQGMSYGAVLTALTKAPPAAKVTELTLTEGRTRHSISALLRAQHVRGNYLAQTRRSPLLDPREYGVRRRLPSLEGFLFPDTYQLVEPIKTSALVADQLRTFKLQFARVNFGYARRHHLTPYDVLTIASLVEAEASTASARPLVASVIYNRLADGMMLQLDSTTRFATGNYTRPLKVSQLRSPSPYNTHTHLGLPPTPIDNPGLSAIQAAAHPARSNYLFFFTRPCGKTVFASTYSQFLAQGSQHLGNRC